MQYDPKQTMKEFNQLMVDVRKAVPEQFEAFIHQKHIVTKTGAVPEKTKWLLLLIATVSQKCHVCIPSAVTHCMAAGWTREEMLEACMVAVLVGGSSVMTYVTFVEKTICELQKEQAAVPN